MKALSKEQLLLLQKPLPPGAISPHPTKQGMSSIKAIFVVERLNEVFGPGCWRLKTELLPVNAAGETILVKTRIVQSSQKERTEYSCVVKTILEVPEHGIYYECIAGSTNDDMGDAAKGGTTDGLTKICSWMGIGMDVYKGEHGKSNDKWLSKIKPDIKAAINDLADCNTTQDLLALKDDLYSFILENPEFVAAARQRYTELSAKTEHAPQPVQPVAQEAIKPGDLGVEIKDGKGNPVDVGKYLADANTLETINATLRWLRIKEKEGYNIKAWQAALHEKAITTLRLSYNSEANVYDSNRPARPERAALVEAAV